MARRLIILFAAASLAALGWFAWQTLPAGREIPGFARALLLFAGGLALPYGALLAQGLLAGTRALCVLALATAVVNGLWVLPLAVAHGLFAGFALGDAAALQRIAALALGAALQVLLGLTAALGLWRSRRQPHGSAPRLRVLVLLPVVASGASWIFWQQQTAAFDSRAAAALADDHATRAALGELRRCLAGFRDSGYPQSLVPCTGAAPTLAAAVGHRFEYLPGQGSAPRGYFLCARPRRFRATGYDTFVADPATVYGDGAAAGLPAGSGLPCAAVLPPERALAYCAYAHAVRGARGSYPPRLAAMHECVRAALPQADLGEDRAALGDGQALAYVAEPAAPGAAVTGFRVYRLGLPGGAVHWLDQALATNVAAAPSPILPPLPDLAAPEPFLDDCARGSAEACFLAGYEWQRRGLQQGAAAGDDWVQEALTAHRRGCELEDARACAWLATLLDGLDDDAPDPRRVVELDVRACQLGFAPSCRRAGEAHARGRAAAASDANLPALAADAEHALRLLRRGCDLGETESCLVAAHLLAGGFPAAVVTGDVLAGLHALCRDGFVQACERGARIAPGSAREFERRACALDPRLACPRQ